MDVGLKLSLFARWRW